MPESELRLIKRWEDYLPVKEINSLPKGLRGFYILYKCSRKTKSYNVVYVGMSSAGNNRGHIRGRLKTHRRKKEGLWSHFSIFEIWDNIREDEIRELEGLFREIYKEDSSANILNKQRGFKKLKRIPKILRKKRDK